MGKQVARNGWTINAYTILAGNLTSSLRRPKLRWEDNIKINLGETRVENVDRIHSIQDSDRCRVLVNMEISLRVSPERITSSVRTLLHERIVN
jgi:hypothetical protein